MLGGNLGSLLYGDVSMMEIRTPGLQIEKLYHYTTDAFFISENIHTTVTFWHCKIMIENDFGTV